MSNVLQIFANLRAIKDPGSLSPEELERQVRAGVADAGAAADFFVLREDGHDDSAVLAARMAEEMDGAA